MFAKKCRIASKAALDLEEILNEYVANEVKKQRDEGDAPTPKNKKNSNLPDDKRARAASISLSDLLGE